MIRNNETKQAWNMFYTRIGSGEVDVVDCNMMLKACYNSEQMKELVDTTMQKVGVAPNVMTYTTYVARLMIEGNVAEEAKRLVKEDMKKMGVQPNQKTRDTLELPAADLNRMRQSKLDQWLREGGNDATAAAWKLFNQLVERGVANEFQCTIMLKACHDSNLMKELMDNSMKKAGVAPDVMTYTHVEINTVMV